MKQSVGVDHEHFGFRERAVSSLLQARLEDIKPEASHLIQGQAGTDRKSYADLFSEGTGPILGVTLDHVDADARLAEFGRAALKFRKTGLADRTVFAAFDHDRLSVMIIYRLAKQQISAADACNGNFRKPFARFDLA